MPVCGVTENNATSNQKTCILPSTLEINSATEFAYDAARLGAYFSGKTVGIGIGGGAGWGAGGVGIMTNGSAMIMVAPNGEGALVFSATIPSAGLLQANMSNGEEGAAANAGLQLFIGRQSALQGGAGIEFDGSYGPFAASASANGVSLTYGVGAGARFGVTISPGASYSIPICK